MPQISTNELGQTLVHLSQDEWETYGRQAGYMGENIKQASTETPTESSEAPQTSNENVIASLRDEMKVISDKLAALSPENVVKESSDAQPKDTTGQNGGIGNEITIRENTEFNEENYPNLVAQQQQEGLIGPFAPRL